MAWVRIAILALVVAASGCREPRAPTTAGNGQASSPQTRSSVMGNQLPTHTPTTRQNLPQEGATIAPQCTLALNLPGGMLDCSFAKCPNTKLAQLMASAEVQLRPRGSAPGWHLVGIRPTPPREFPLSLALVTQGDSLVLLPTDGSKEGDEGECVASRGVVADLAGDADFLEVKGWVVRRLPRENGQAAVRSAQ